MKPRNLKIRLNRNYRRTSSWEQSMVFYVRVGHMRAWFLPFSWGSYRVWPRIRWNWKNLKVFLGPNQLPPNYLNLLEYTRIIGERYAMLKVFAGGGEDYCQEVGKGENTICETAKEKMD